jgi:serine/threonine protein kinase
MSAVLDKGKRASRALNRPRSVGEYQLERLLGTGGMASVYCARHVDGGRPVAIKVIAPHLVTDPRASGRFEAEARAVMRIDHPNVIRVFQTGRLSDGTLYQVMELLEGQDLGEVIARAGTLTPHQVLPYLRQICAGLQAAHDRGVVHRDLKPQNIFVLDGEPTRLKLLDFGIAKLLAPGDTHNFTATGVTLGTPRFIAPEQACGDKDRISPQTDLYSLGVILYVMLSGTPPFAGDLEALLLSHVTEPLPPLRTRAYEVPVTVADVVHRCLEKDPADRPDSATTVVEMYEAALESATVVDVTSPWFASEPSCVHAARYDALEATVHDAVAPPPLVELSSAPTVLFRSPTQSESTARVRVGPPPAAVVIIAVTLLLLLLALTYYALL